jgi:ankyrin repeat protein
MNRILKSIATTLFSEAGAAALLGGDEFHPEQPILLAAAEGDLTRIHLLLAASSDPNARDKRRQTPLMHAARNGHLDVVEALLAAGADVNARAKKGLTAVEAAREGSHHEVLRRLECAACSS